MADRNNDLSKHSRRLRHFFHTVPFVLSMACLCNVCLPGQNLSHSDIIKKSRESCVRILINSKSPSGSGFFIDPNLVVTCFHVITKEWPVDPNTKKFDATKWRPHPDIVVKTASEETIPAECISPPKATDISPYRFDFAILRLKTKPTKSYVSVPFCKNSPSLAIGDDVYFSGFPLGAPAMLTHKGMLSGFTKNQSMLCIQAPINKGNSGCALLNTRGEVIGIISNREGGISQELNRIRKQIVDVEQKKRGSITAFSINPLSVDKDIINILNRYISTGIGYARNISYARQYTQRHSLMKSVSTVK